MGEVSSSKLDAVQEKKNKKCVRSKVIKRKREKNGARGKENRQKDSAV